jgi:hypothetical protein
MSVILGLDSDLKKILNFKRLSQGLSSNYSLDESLKLKGNKFQESLTLNEYIEQQKISVEFSSHVYAISSSYCNIGLIRSGNLNTEVCVKYALKNYYVSISF